jgi:hypothetical protein
MLVDCDTISVKKGDLYLKLIELDLAGTIGDVEDPHLILIQYLCQRRNLKKKWNC